MESKAALINQPVAAFSIQGDIASRRVVLMRSSAYKRPVKTSTFSNLRVVCMNNYNLWITANRSRPQI